MKNSPILDNEFSALARIAQRRVDDGDATIEHEAIIHAHSKIAHQAKCLKFILSKVVVGDNGTFTVVGGHFRPANSMLEDNLSMINLVKAMSKPESKLQAV